SVEAFADDLVVALGDASEGQESLADLIHQTEEDAEPSPVDDWERLRVPLTARHPWIPGAIRRLLAARPVYGYRYPGRRHDIGNPQGYLETLQAFA
ncbi:MAG: hypothetical protein J6V72_09010, partial [Kiritimatiellae bacterium]|nr:hypothetical protein [Kiritimatiellia bacterium]